MDSFRFLLKLNLSKKNRNIHSGPNLKVDEIYSVAEALTLRMVLSQGNGLYDPIGLIAPYILELKVALGILWKVMKNIEPDPKIVWDLPITNDFDQNIRDRLNAGSHLQDLRFPRVI